MAQKLITMSHKELSKYEMIIKLIHGKMNGPEVSKILRLSVRHIRRLKALVRKHGAKALIHGNRGKPGNRRMPEETIFQIEKIVKEKYHDFGPTFASEKLQEENVVRCQEPRNLFYLKRFLTPFSTWLRVERYPAYAPELSPVEFIWSPMKTKDLGNMPPKGLKHLKRIVRRSFKRIKADKVLLKNCLRKAGVFKY